MDGYTTAEVAKMFPDMPTRRLSKKLSEMGLAFRENGRWRLTLSGLQYGDYDEEMFNGRPIFKIKWNDKLVKELKERLK
jgi:hypothetical protein